MGGADQPQVHLPLFRPSQPAEAEILKHLQQFRLHRCIQVSDFVQEQRPVLGLVHFAAAGMVGAGKRSRFATEQFAFNQAVRQAWTVDLHKRAVASCRQRMQILCDNILAGAAFPGDKNRHSGGGCQLNLAPNSRHCLGVSQQDRHRS